MPAVEVAGAGTLSFPVPDAQIAAIVRRAERAPYGRGEETIVDTSVRNVWQIAPRGGRATGWWFRSAAIRRSPGVETTLSLSPSWKRFWLNGEFACAPDRALAYESRVVLLARRAASSRTGHHGLLGLRERAQLAGGNFTVQSSPEFGTQIELTIPASLAYMKSRALRGPTASGKGA